MTQMYAVQQFATQVATLAVMANVMSTMGAMAGVMFGFAPSGRTCPELPRFAYVPDEPVSGMELKEIFDELKWIDRQVQASVRAQAEDNKIALVLQRVLSHVGDPSAVAEIRLAQENLATLGRWYPSAAHFVPHLRQVELYVEENRKDKAEGEIKWLMDCVASAAWEAEQFREKAAKRAEILDKERGLRVSQIIRRRAKEKLAGRAGPSWYEALRGVPERPAREPTAGEREAQLGAKTEHEKKMKVIRQKLIDIDRKEL